MRKFFFSACSFVLHACLSICVVLYSSSLFSQWHLVVFSTRAVPPEVFLFAVLLLSFVGKAMRDSLLFSIAAAAQGAVDEESFIRAFEDVPKVNVSSACRDAVIKM